MRKVEPESDADCEHSAHKTDTYQFGNENNLEKPLPVEPYPPYNNINGIPVYYGKDNEFHWFKHVPPVLGCTRRRNLVMHLSGEKKIAKR